MPQEFWENNLPTLDGLFSDMKQRHTVLDATVLTYKKWADSDTKMRWDYEIAKRCAAFSKCGRGSKWLHCLRERLLPGF